MRELQSGYVIFQAFLCHNTHQKKGGEGREGVSYRSQWNIFSCQHILTEGCSLLPTESALAVKAKLLNTDPENGMCKISYQVDFLFFKLLYTIPLKAYLF